MSHISNPLATAAQLYEARSSVYALPLELQDSIRFQTARLTQAAGILLRLPQDITAQANVLLYRFWVVENLTTHEFSDVSAAVLYLTAKVSASPRSLRSITNVYAYLLSSDSSNPESYYLSEGNYVAFRTRILLLEGLVLNALSFDLHVALPHALAITYLQTLALFPEPGPRVAKRTIQYLNTALLSPQMLYLTHQPNSLAVAAIYLAAKDENVKLPEVEWWEVFDVDREELGFLVMGMGSLLGTVKDVGRKMITNADIPDVVGEEDEETKMARLLDKKVGDT